MYTHSVHRTSCSSAMLRKGIIMKLLWAIGERDTIFLPILKISPCEHYRNMKCTLSSEQKKQDSRLHEHIFSFLFKIIIKESAHMYMLISSLMILERNEWANALEWNHVSSVLGNFELWYALHDSCCCCCENFCNN